MAFADRQGEFPIDVFEVADADQYFACSQTPIGNLCVAAAILEFALVGCAVFEADETAESFVVHLDDVVFVANQLDLEALGAKSAPDALPLVEQVGGGDRAADLEDAVIIQEGTIAFQPAVRDLLAIEEGTPLLDDDQVRSHLARPIGEQRDEAAEQQDEDEDRADNADRPRPGRARRLLLERAAARARPVVVSGDCRRRFARGRRRGWHRLAVGVKKDRRQRVCRWYDQQLLAARTLPRLAGHLLADLNQRLAPGTGKRYRHVYTSRL